MPRGMVSRIALLAAGCLLVAVACTSDRGPSPANPSSESVDVPIIEVSARWASANARDLSTLIQTTGTVFVGRVTDLKGQRYERMLPAGVENTENTGAVPSGKPLTGGGPAPFPISLFDITVDQSLAGGLVAGQKIVMEQAGGVSERSDGTQVILRLEATEPLEVGAAYLFFASPAPNGNGNYVSPPWGRLKIDGSGKLTAPATWSRLGAPQQLTGANVGEAAARVARTARQ